MRKNNFLFILIITLGYRLLGFLREVMIASQYGAGGETDIYFVSQMIPNLILELLAIGGISSIIIAKFDFKKTDEWRNDANVIVSNIVVSSSILFIVVIFLIEIFIKILVPGFDNESKIMAVKLTRISIISMPFILVNGVISSFINGLNKGHLISISNFINNLIIVLVGYIFGYIFGIRSFILGIVVASIVRLAYIYYCYFKIYGKISFKIDFKNKNFIDIIKLFTPVIITSIGVQLNFVVDRMIASTFEKGAISQLTYVEKLIQLPLGIILGSAILSSYPELVEKLRKTTETQEYIYKKLETILIIMGGIVVYILVFSENIISVIYNTRVYTQNLVITSEFFRIMSFMIILISLITLYQKIFHGLQITRLPAMATYISIALNIIFSYLLSKFLGVKGIIFSTLIANFINIVILFISLKKYVIIEYKVFRILVIVLFHILSYIILKGIFFRFIEKIVGSIIIIKLVFLGIGFLCLIMLYFIFIKYFVKEKIY